MKATLRFAAAVGGIVFVLAATSAARAGDGLCHCNVSVISGATGLTLTSQGVKGPCGRPMATAKVAAVEATAKAMAGRAGPQTIAEAAFGAPVASEPVFGPIAASTPVSVFSNGYSPSPVTIHQGDTVVWSFDSGFHTVTSVSGSVESFNSNGQSGGIGATFSHTFTHVGTFSYYCQFHGQDNGNGTASGMASSINVLPVPEPAVGLLLLPGLLLLRRRSA